MPFYQYVIEDILKVKEQWLQTHAEYIREKLQTATEDLDREHGRMFGINQCVRNSSGGLNILLDKCSDIV